jgi:hypothetical protein
VNDGVTAALGGVVCVLVGASGAACVTWKSWNCTLTLSVDDAQFGTLIVSTP